MLKLLHLADLHFDATFRCRSNRTRMRLREAIRIAFVRAMDTAVSERVDAVLLAGDLFDGNRLSFTTEKLLHEQFQRLSRENIPVFSACGNHDPASLRPRAGGVDWPDNCTFFNSGEPRRVELHDAAGTARAVVVGAGHENANEERNLAASFPPASGDLPHIGLLHTMVTSAGSAESHDRYAPCSVDDLTRLGYDYWALGHIHQRQPVDREERVWYSGNIQGRNPRETGSKGGLLVTLTASRTPDIHFVPFAPIEWVTLHLDDLSGVRNLADLEARVESAFSEYETSKSADDCIVVVGFHGDCIMADDLRTPASVEEVESLLADQLGVMDVEVRVEGLTAPLAVEEHAREPHVLGEVLRLISHYEGSPGAIDRVAPADLANSVVGTDERLAYLEALLSGLDREAVRRLLLNS